jgi:hypothetical protein
MKAAKNGLLVCGKYLLGILKANLQKKTGYLLIVLFAIFATRSSRWMDLERKCGL